MSYGVQQSLNRQVNVPPPPPNAERDTVTRRLEITNGVLGECESLLARIEDAIAPVPTAGAASAVAQGPLGISGLTMDVHSRALRIAETLTRVMNAVA